MNEAVIVVPCFNEASRLDAGAFRAFARTCRVRFLFVDDGSTDGTRSLIEGLARETPDSFSALSLERNRGKAEAVRAGILRAIDEGAAITGFWDADLSTPLDELPRMLMTLRERPGIEMVFGSRVNLLGRSIQRKLFRHYVSRAFATAAAWALRLPIYDTQCGAKVFRTTADLRAAFAEPFISKWIFDVEIIARLILARTAAGGVPVERIIYEQPLDRWSDVGGSKLRPRHFVIVWGDIARIWLRYLSPSRLSGARRSAPRRPSPLLAAPRRGAATRNRD